MYIGLNFKRCPQLVHQQIKRKKNNEDTGLYFYLRRRLEMVITITKDNYFKNYSQKIDLQCQRLILWRNHVFLLCISLLSVNPLELPGTLKPSSSPESVL